MKKIISLVLAVLMLMSVMAVFASAECDHVYGDKKEVIVAATCKEEGKAKVTCTKCGSPKLVTIPKAEHEEKYLKTISAVPALCEKDGHNEYKYCPICGQDVGKETYPALGHDLYEVIDIALPSCDSRGQGHIKCSRTHTEIDPLTKLPKELKCDYSVLVDYPALDHRDANEDGLCDLCEYDMVSCKCICHGESIFARLYIFINTLMNKIFPTYERDIHGKLILDEEGNKIQLYYHCCDCRIPEGQKGV